MILPAHIHEIADVIDDLLQRHFGGVDNNSIVGLGKR
jgi:hypothetical protein